MPILFWSQSRSSGTIRLGFGNNPLVIDSSNVRDKNVHSGINRDTPLCRLSVAEALTEEVTNLALVFLSRLTTLLYACCHLLGAMAMPRGQAYTDAVDKTVSHVAGPFGNEVLPTMLVLAVKGPGCILRDSGNFGRLSFA